ncbi:hypothetical protein DPMN_133011 [Dreissena polymorpha]|uniref:Uncharacterized protein n=1 Tax=Dreissena polymorpha TaxID=45954 RepID=A0A9D4JDL6_DREPO|nr:hypothetical protein DPMN_133011 [Dreissena polymorpha]
MLSVIAELPFFHCLMVLLISSFLDLQRFICRPFVAGGISDAFAGTGLLDSSRKCSIHLFFCPSSSVGIHPF